MSGSAGPAVHPNIAHLAALVGTWRGKGAGHYPTIADFAYVEEVTFGHVGKPFLAYAQKTRNADSDLPMHAECGYLRPAGEGRVEFVLVHPTGVLESQAGTVTSQHSGDPDSGADTAAGLILDLESADITLTATAKSVTRVERRFVLSGDTLSYDVSMAAVGHELTHHLQASLTRS